ncbi:hypothetical protein [Vibrio cincinnatiensis]|uniref:hypothetical protein n=1 Tax=Vibrio cincinnatiensis TaxID=675 RepID=UPI001EDFE448|nr:hypothetical protein [Vibrio cincinnatiensis]
MSNALRKELKKAIESDKNVEVTFERAPKEVVQAAIKEVMKSHKKTISELADR